VDWLFSHPSDEGEEVIEIDETQPAESTPCSLPGTTALPSRYKLRAFISHNGPSVHSGHYIAHIRTDDNKWVLFNDEKVVEADQESVDGLKKLAYLYFFERI
jgi:ubiquitin carboxyl-terminal hydrolase 5/13